jgi:WD40 repeat protein
LRELIDARLLTSYEVREEDREPIRRVEIIHESLLANWPRLVGWQTQDADSARLREELRQAARSWQEHDRPDDRLWTGSAYREYQLWNERYPGGLTDTEEAFGEAMTRHAERRKRRRRAALAATFSVLLAVLAVIGAFWRRSLSEARRAEAASLFSLAQLQLEDHPTATVAYAIRSLELADSPEMRRMVLDALWRGPTEFRIPVGSFYSVEFSPDSRWLVTGNEEDGAMLWPANGGPPTTLEAKADGVFEHRFSPDGELIASYLGGGQELGLWSLPSGRLLRSLAVGGLYNQFFWFSRDGKRVITTTENIVGDRIEIMIRSWPAEGGEPNLLAQFEVPMESGGTFFGLDATESRVAWIDGRNFNLASLTQADPGSAPRVSLEHERDLTAAFFDDEGRQLATSDTAGTITVWSLEHDPPELARAVAVGHRNNWCSMRFDRSGSMLCAKGGYLVDLSAPQAAMPLRLRRPGQYGFGQAFEPNGRWFAIGHSDSVSLWPLARQYPLVLRAQDHNPTGFHFSPESDWIAAKSTEGAVGLWPLAGGPNQKPKILFQAEGAWEAPNILAMAPDGSFLATGCPNGAVRVLPVDDGPSHKLVGFTDAISELVAAGSGHFFREEAIVRVWDLESGEVRILDAGDGMVITLMWFTGDGDLWVRSGSTLRRWNLDGDPPRIVEEVDLTDAEFSGYELCAFDPDLRRLLLEGRTSVWIHDLDTHESRELRSHDSCQWFSLQAGRETIVTVDAQGGIRVGPVTGEEPHLLLGREGGNVAVSSDSRWIAARGPDHTIKLWPMPDLSKPPLHTLPRAELIAKLKALTNLRVVEDPDSPSGWKLEIGPFPGWETVPTW